MESAFKVHLAVQGVVSRALQDVLDGTLVVPGCVPGLPTRGDVSQAAAPRATPAARPAEDEEDVDSIHIAQLLAEAQKVIVMAGAGLSTAAGIPDFRTPGSGLYYQLEKYDLPNPQAVFSIDYFRVRPEPFHMLAREMWPGKFAPTAAHAFIKMLADKGKLLRCYTQNIDGLERLAGVPPELLMECHGTFATAHAIDPPNKEFDIGWYREQLQAGSTQIRCPETGSLVKPDIVFFGESLPANFGQMVNEDFPECDLLIIIGTSLTVQPFAGLVRYVKPQVRRVLVNMFPAGETLLDFKKAAVDAASEKTEKKDGDLGEGEDSVDLSLPANRRDFALLGDCQHSIHRLARLAGWDAELAGIAEGLRGKTGAAGAAPDAADALAEALAMGMDKLGL
mmetsp:Transcript_6578/g.15923  ORF Transcript_6578/g.15923 Transcript_6578/m.15923 type:complete len:394 (-) Transcript_6578:220-1401(-)